MFKINQIKKIHNNQAQGWQEREVFFATTARKSCTEKRKHPEAKSNQIKNITFKNKAGKRG